MELGDAAMGLPTSSYNIIEESETVRVEEDRVTTSVVAHNQ